MKKQSNNWYKKIITSRSNGYGTFDMISDPDKKDQEDTQYLDEDPMSNMNKPFDQSGSMGGTDYYTDPGVGSSPKDFSKDQTSTRQRFGFEGDGEDPDLNDRKTTIQGNQALFSPNDALSRTQFVNQQKVRNKVVGPLNQQRYKQDNFLDNIRHRIN